MIPSSMSRPLARAGGAVLLALAPAWVHAAFNAPISFGQAGTVTLTLEASTGGLDHILELASSPGPVGAAPLMAMTRGPGDMPSADVLGFLPASVGDSIGLGSFAAGAELIFRLTNVESIALGNPGTLAGQVFTGSASNLNASPTDYYSFVEILSPTSIRVTLEDLFPVDATTVAPDPLSIANGADVQFLLTLSPTVTAPVPEPGTYALMLAGLAATAWVSRRRRRS